MSRPEVGKGNPQLISPGDMFGQPNPGGDWGKFERKIGCQKFRWCAFDSLGTAYTLFKKIKQWTLLLGGGGGFKQRCHPLNSKTPRISATKISAIASGLDFEPQQQSVTSSLSRSHDGLIPYFEVIDVVRKNLMNNPNLIMPPPLWTPSEINFPTHISLMGEGGVQVKFIYKGKG